MGFLDRLLGREEPQNTRDNSPFGNTNAFGARGQNSTRTPMSVTDEQALARYRYMLQTAPPEDVERAHEEAFAQLTPEQRQLVLEQLAQQTPDNERDSLRDDPRSLARAATRAEMRRPGTMERTFGGANAGGGMMGGMGGGMMGGMGGMMMGGILTSIAGGFLGSAIANSFFSNPAVASDYSQSDAAQGAGDTDASSYSDMSAPDPVDSFGDPDAAQSTDSYGDPDAGGDFGGDSGFDGSDFGGDFGGDF